MYGLLAFAERLNIQNCLNSTGNCVRCMYEMSEFIEKLNSADTLNAQNRVNPMRNCVHEIYGLSGFEEI